ncbi:hypothetical protein ACFFX0_25410 [Citricoccus parietis]|uniref:Uncharacterized protein n=1 Tax=Citricoccus parietis TaxID=592307 RepID=A0ABV5G5X2_9MICC
MSGQQLTGLLIEGVRGPGGAGRVGCRRGRGLGLGGAGDQGAGAEQGQAAGEQGSAGQGGHGVLSASRLIARTNPPFCPDRPGWPRRSV